jgi:AbiJ N-terminal domain 4
MPPFSQRKGYRSARETIQSGKMDESLRNGLWNAFYMMVLQREGFMDPGNYTRGEIHLFAELFFAKFLKKPIDDRPHGDEKLYSYFRQVFLQSFRWYEVYDFVEFVVSHVRAPERFVRMTNQVLEAEMAGYRLVDGQIVEVTSQPEIDSVDSALTQTDFPGASEHLRRALQLVSDRQQPDPRNSIKESISAVESVAKAIAATQKATLEDAIRVLEKGGSLHPSLKAGLSKLYGYTSDKGGIRHAMLEEPDVSKTDALFFLVICSAFVNYLRSKTSK